MQSLVKCKGQCYDGASTMKGARTGGAKQTTDEESRAVYMHCYGHALKLAVGDAVKQSKVMRDAMDTTYEVSKLIKYSPKRDVEFEKLKESLAPDTPGFRVLCPTRWTVRADSLKSVVDNYVVLQELWEVAKNETNDPSIKARIIGVEAQFNTFSYLFGYISLGKLLLRHSDNLSKTLQSPKLSAAESQRIASTTVKALQSIRDDTLIFFDKKWKVYDHRWMLRNPNCLGKERFPEGMRKGLLMLSTLMIAKHIIVSSIMKPWTSSPHQ